MKNKKLIIGGVAILILYFLYKKKSKQTVVDEVKKDEKTYFRSRDGRVLQCAEGTRGGTKESPRPISCLPI
mgnify:CR=1 FL=1